jgi:stage V sporulation protein AA
MACTLYLKLNESVLAKDRHIHIKDLGKVVCDDPEIKKRTENIRLMTFSSGISSGTKGEKKHGKEQQVISVMDIIEEIKKETQDVLVNNIGAADIIVYYKEFDGADRLKQSLKLILVCLIAFLGSGFSIMSYNSDVNMVGQLDLMQEIFAGGSETGQQIAGIAYSVGLFFGIIIFFNHGTNKKFSDDPTPLQVQMRKYEQDVNQTIITDAERKKDVRDAD